MFVIDLNRQKQNNDKIKFWKSDPSNVCISLTIPMAEKEKVSSPVLSEQI